VGTAGSTGIVLALLGVVLGGGGLVALLRVRTQNRAESTQADVARLAAMSTLADQQQTRADKERDYLAVQLDDERREHATTRAELEHVRAALAAAPARAPRRRGAAP